MSEEVIDQVNPKYLDISPLTKGKRMLVYLADLFLNFFVALILFSVAVYPIGKIVGGYDSYQEKLYENQVERLDILYDNYLLDYDENDDSADKYNITTSLEFSANAYLIGFLEETYEPDYFSLFYIDYLGEDVDAVKNLLQEYDSYGFFDYTGESIVLSDSYKTSFSPLLDENDSLSSTAQSAYNYFIQSFFANIYSEMMYVILDSEKITSESPLYQYRVLDDQNDELTYQMNMISVYCTYISYFLGSVIYFLVIPVVSRRGKTIPMMALRRERVVMENFKILKRRDRILYSFYQMVMCLPLIMLVPVMYIDIATVFSLPYLFYLSLISLVLVLASFIFIFCNHYHRTLGDFISKTVLISTDDLEKIYASKGYMI